MRAKTVWILLVVVILLGGYVYYYEIRSESRFLSSEQAEEGARKVFPKLACRADDLLDEVSGVTIERREGKVVLTRTDQTWRLIEPVDARASKSAVETLVRSILEMGKQDRNIPKEDFTEKGLAEYGLDVPGLKLSITVAGRTYEVDFGAQDPMGNEVYAKRSDAGDVMHVDKDTCDGLKKDANDLRERRLLSFSGAELARIELTSSKRQVTLVRKDPDWFLEAPVSDRTDSIRTESLIKKLGELEADDFIDSANADQLKSFGLAPAQARVELVLSGKAAPAALLLGRAVPDRPGKVYAKVDGEAVVTVVSDEILGSVARDAGYFRDRMLARLSAADVTVIELTPAEGASLLLEKADEIWKIKSPKEIDADEPSADELAREIASVRIIRYVDEAPKNLGRYGLDEKNAHLIRVVGQGKAEQMFRVGRVDRSNKDVFIQRVGQNAVFTVKESFLEDVARSDYLKLRTRKVADINRYDINKLTVTVDGRTTVMEKTANEWFMTQPVSGPAYDQAVTGLLGHIDGLEADRLLAERIDDPTKWGLDKPVARLVAEVARPDENPKVYELLIGKPLDGGGHAAKLADGDLLFAVSGILLDDLRTEFYDRVIWDFKTDQINRMVWKKGTLEVVLRKEDRSWVLIRPDGRTLNRSRVSALVRDLKYLSVDRFLSYSKADAKKFGLGKPVVVITVAADDAERTLTVGKPDKKGRAPAMVSDKEGIFELAPDLTERINTGVLSAGEPGKELPK